MKKTITSPYDVAEHLRTPKEMLSLRMDFDVLEKLRASGKGWQTRLNKYIKDAVMRGDL